MEMNDSLGAGWYERVVADLRDKIGPDDEATVWVLFVDEERHLRVGMAIESDGRVLGAPEFDSLTEIIDDIDPPAVLIAVSRVSGEPLPADRQLRQEMRGRLAALTRAELIDVLVVGRHSWVALGGRSDRAA
jgi:hypothetical protein